MTGSFAGDSLMEKRRVIEKKGFIGKLALNEVLFLVIFHSIFPQEKMNSKFIKIFILEGQELT